MYRIQAKLVVLKWIIHVPLISSCSCVYFISWGCMLEITLNSDCTEESLAILRPRWELLFILLTKISKLLCKARKNCSWSPSSAPF